jgi:outer membrane protein, adhesin transport system
MLVRGFACAVLTVPVLGCAQGPTSSPSQELPAEAGTEVLTDTPAAPPLEATVRPATRTNLVAGTRLSTLAAQIDEVAIVRSSTVQQVRAAEAELQARRFDSYPQIRPTASAPLTGGGSASLGLSIEQLIWDGGRIRARLSDAELKIAEASLRAWAERNEAVHDGLEAYVNMARYEARIVELGRLNQKLGEIKSLLETRLAGGVADRGELLRMNVALQELKRRLVSDTAALRQARADFLRQLPDAINTPSLPDLRAASSQCSRVWPVSEAPADALARVTTARAAISEEVVRAQRFPKVLLAGSSNYSQDGFSEPTIGIRLDASDMLGLGRKANLEAAEASSQAAAAAYALQKDETMTDLARLDADFDRLQSDVASLREFVQQNEASLDLYEEQLDAGSIALTDGIVLHREQSDTLITLIDVEADSLLNCLSSSARRGLLARFEVTNNAN